MKNTIRDGVKNMGGPLNLDSTAWVSKDTVQDSIDSLNKAIDRLDNLIHEMQGNCECKK